MFGMERDTLYSFVKKCIRTLVSYVQKVAYFSVHLQTLKVSPIFLNHLVYVYIPLYTLERFYAFLDLFEANHNLILATTFLLLYKEFPLLFKSTTNDY